MPEYPGGGACRSCGAELGPLDFGRSDACPSCGRDAKTCVNCRHFDPAGGGSCREEAAEPVESFEKANFCDYFSPHPPVSGVRSSPQDSPAAGAKAAFDALFKKRSLP